MRVFATGATGLVGSAIADSVKGGVISDRGHWVMEEQPAKLLEDLGQFLRE